MGRALTNDGPSEHEESTGGRSMADGGQRKRGLC